MIDFSIQRRRWPEKRQFDRKKKLNTVAYKGLAKK